MHSITRDTGMLGINPVGTQCWKTSTFPWNKPSFIQSSWNKNLIGIQSRLVHPRGRGKKSHWCRVTPRAHSRALFCIMRFSAQTDSPPLYVRRRRLSSAASLQALVCPLLWARGSCAAPSAASPFSRQVTARRRHSHCGATDSFMFVYICVCGCVQVYINTHTLSYVSMYVCMYAFIHAWM